MSAFLTDKHFIWDVSLFFSDNILTWNGKIIKWPLRFHNKVRFLTFIMFLTLLETMLGFWHYGPNSLVLIWFLFLVLIYIYVYIFFSCLLNHSSIVPSFRKLLKIVMASQNGMRIFFLRFYLFIFRGEGKEKEKERNISVWLTLVHLLLGTWLATQACALTGNQTGDSLVCKPALNPLTTPAGVWGFYFNKNNCAVLFAKWL